MYASDTKITNSCRNCEEEFGGWKEKDILYAVGNVKNNNLKNLWFVYGSLYAANKDTYEKAANKIIYGIEQIKDIELTETNELAKINKVDPLGITYLRFRGMWGIKNPATVFSNIILPKSESLFNLTALIPLEKYESFPENDKLRLENSKAYLKNVEVQNPNNPAKFIKAKMISYSI